MITFRTKSSESQFLIRKVDRANCMYCKVVLGESVVTQHRLLVLDIRLKSFRKFKLKLDHKIKY